MEGRVGALERLANKQGRAITEIRDTMQELRESFQEMKDMLRKSRTHERGSEGSQSSVSGARKGMKKKKREEDAMDNNGSRKSEEEPLFPWAGGELFTFERNGTQGQTTRATNVLEVHNNKGSTKVHLTVNNKEENAVQGFKTWQ
ncbi:hypothetical protein LR48_Vigan07g227000 [Vigna angularis]|uniref:Uncharacterized protein n=1 Tax=Phaseolus angularis TaxID=3914 RepID=A0A0L9V0U8_PHAAN|nr:hypothetical protein LR48_Vigan07g227000 [Vigna angularis]